MDDKHLGTSFRPSTPKYWFLKGFSPDTSRLTPTLFTRGPDGQVVVDVFPATGYDRLLLNGYKAQVWIEPGVSAEQTRAEAAALYRGTDPVTPRCAWS
jgi:hypothetical protein